MRKTINLSTFSATQVYDSAQRPPAMLEELIEILHHRDLLVQLITRNVKIRYKRSVLGIVWTMLNPLLMMIILAFVFSNLFPITLEHYPVYVLSALTFWNFFSQMTSDAMNDLV